MGIKWKRLVGLINSAQSRARFFYMKEAAVAEQQGMAVVSLLRNPAALQGRMWNHTGLFVTAETGDRSFWSRFVSFPPELSRAFPGSYVDPHVFLKELGYEKKRAGEVPLEAILGVDRGSYKEPVLLHEEEGFGLRVLNGSLNSHAIEMSRLATADVNNPQVRARYQNEMYRNIEPALGAEVPPYGIRIHDDCLASGDSIAGYLMYRVQEDPAALAKGVEILIDGPATAQGILFLKAFAKAHGFPINITAGHMAFGLSAGVEEGNVRKHANYITYPDGLLKYFPETYKRRLESYRGKDGTIAVVGDMGEYEKGIPDGIMQEMRKVYGPEDLCPWNDHREDPHGDHIRRNGFLPVPSRQEGLPDDVYFARGGYLPYAFDKLKNPHFGETNKIVERASRLWTAEYGYGAGFIDAAEAEALSRAAKSA